MLPLLHARLTKKLLLKNGFSPEAARIVAETVMWPDWYRWNDLEYHAATPHNIHHAPTDPALAAENSSRLLRSFIEHIRAAAMSEQLVWLGFALHLVQDLAVHQGRTTLEHSSQALAVFTNPDYNRERYSCASSYSWILLEALPRLIGDTAYKELCQSVQARLLTLDEQSKLLGPRDFSPWTLWSFFGQGLRYWKNRNPNKRVRWDTEQVLANGLQ